MNLNYRINPFLKDLGTYVKKIQIHSYQLLNKIGLSLDK